jgi:dihydrolipoamide dehydrogenase
MAADLGLEVTLVEADRRLGGTCLLRGCIPSKALLHVAKVVAEARAVAEWGVAFDPPRFNLEGMRAHKEKILSTLSGGLSQLAKRRKVRIIQARGVFVDSQTLQLEATGSDGVENSRLTYDHCILATGSIPAMPKAFRLETDRVMDSTGALELADIPERLLVVGGGYIGLEMGTVYAELGSKVTVVEMMDGLLPGADRDLVAPLAKRLQERFEAIHLNTKVASLTDRGGKIEVALEGPGASGSDQFDRVLVSIGRRPSTQGIGLENTEVSISEKGFVLVDHQQRTSDPHILAIGDVAGEPMLAHKASHEGKVAAEVIAGGYPARGSSGCRVAAAFEPAAIPAVVFTDPEIAWAGLTEGDAQREGREIAVAQYPWQASGRAIAVGRTDGLTKWIIDPATERVLGCGIVGAGAGELISEAVLAVEMGAQVRDVAESIHPHPTLSETLSFASEVYLGTATEVYRPKREKKQAV